MVTEKKVGQLDIRLSSYCQFLKSQLTWRAWVMVNWASPAVFFSKYFGTDREGMASVLDQRNLVCSNWINDGRY